MPAPAAAAHTPADPAHPTPARRRNRTAAAARAAHPGRGTRTSPRPAGPGSGPRATRNSAGRCRRCGTAHQPARSACPAEHRRPPADKRTCSGPGARRPPREHARGDQNRADRTCLPHQHPTPGSAWPRPRLLARNGRIPGSPSAPAAPLASTRLAMPITAVDSSQTPPTRATSEQRRSAYSIGYNTDSRGDRVCAPLKSRADHARLERRPSLVVPYRRLFGCGCRARLPSMIGPERPFQRTGGGLHSALASVGSAAQARGRVPISDALGGLRFPARLLGRCRQGRRRGRLGACLRGTAARRPALRGR
jgi:hypothetical protein